MSEQKKPDYLIVFFSITLLIGVAIMGMFMLSGCSVSFSRDTDTKGMEHTHKTDFNVTTKF